MSLYQTSRWKARRARFIIGKFCDWNSQHSGPLTLDHLSYINSDGSSMTEDQLMDFKKLYAEKRLIVLCRKCAFARRHNKILCERCGDHYHGKKRGICFECIVKDSPHEYTLCSDCGANQHNKKYSRCYSCNLKMKRSRSASRGWRTRRNKGRKI